MSRRSLIVSIFTVGIAGCAAAGTRPGDMSQSQHEAMARQEDSVASGHAGQYDPNAIAPTEHCARGSASNPCWTSVANPTDKHKSEADSHRSLASKHRAAAAALAQAEATACAGIDEDDRDASPFYHKEDIASVSPLDKDVAQGKQTAKQPGGAIVVFRAVPGLTQEWLQHEINCHQARAASVGYDMPEMGYCPLMLKGVKATVTSAGDGFAVKLESDDVETAKQILGRTQALAASK